MKERDEFDLIEEENSNLKYIIFWVLLVLVILLFSINIGYAYEYSNTDNLDTANINGKMEMLFDNAYIVQKEGIEGDVSISILNDKKELYINAGNLKYPGAKVEYSVDIFNNSTVTSKIESIRCDGLENTNAIRLEGLEKLNDSIKLKPGDKYSLKFVVIWDENYNENTDESANFMIQLNFIQDIDY